MLAVATVQTAELQTAEKSFWAVVDEWLKWLKEEKDKKGRTLKVYRYNMGVFKAWLDSEGIEQATRQDIKNWKQFMNAARNSKGELLSVSTKNLYLTTVRNFYKWLADEYGVDNVAAGIDGWKNSKEHKRGTLNIEEMKELINIVDPVAEQKITNEKAKLEAVQKEAQENGRNFNFAGLIARYEKNVRLQALRDKAILSALMAGGLRTIEISRLTIADIDTVGGVCYLYVLGKGRDERESVKISRKAEKVIRAWLDAREAVDVVSDDSPLFCSVSNNSFGEILSSLSISRLVKEYLRAAGLKEKEYKAETKKGKIKRKPIVAHSLRASMATNAFKKGAKLDQVQQQLRHKNITTTMIYLEEAEKECNPCSDLVSDAIFC